MNEKFQKKMSSLVKKLMEKDEIKEEEFPLDQKEDLSSVLRTPSTSSPVMRQIPRRLPRLDYAQMEDAYADDFIFEEPEEEQHLHFQPPPPPRLNGLFANGICPFDLGEKVLTYPSEELPAITRMAHEATRSRLQFDYTTLNSLLENGTDEMKVFCAGLAGLMKVMEATFERTTIQKLPNDETNLRATFEPARLPYVEQIVVKDLDMTGEVRVNEILAHVPAMSGSLKSVVQACANKWAQETVPENKRHLYSTSLKPQVPQISFPTHLLNAPAAVLAKVITITGGNPTKAGITIGLLFKNHLNYIFQHARHNRSDGIDAKKSRRQTSSAQ
uniref:Uncharacterized protein n=2 Tax=Caenorhabditis japonica TaxID=281687 RepID=A0A8R1E4V1_CAEJA